MEYTGAVELRYVAGKLRKAAVKDLRRELAKAQRQTFKPLQREIVAQAIVILPHTGGLAGIIARAIRVSVRQNLDRREVTAVVYARSRRQLRDIAAMNRGQLRHPVYGRTRWVLQQITPGLVDRPAERIGPRLAKESLDALERVVAEIVR